MHSKRNHPLLPVLLMVGCLWTPLSAVQFSLKLTGGMSIFERGKIDRVVDSWAEWQRLESESRNLWTLQSVNLEYMPPLTEIEGELVCRFHPRWAVSAGVGLIYSEVSVDDALLVITKSTTDNDIAHPQKVSAVPLILSVYHFLPLSHSFELYARAGGGWMSLDYYDQEASKKTENKKYAFSLEQNAGGDTGIFQAALGMTIATSTGLSFMVEAGYRGAAVSGLTGEIVEGVSGTMYAYEQYDPALDFWRYRHRVLAEAPAGEDIRNVEELAIDLSGVSVRIGILIRF